MYIPSNFEPVKENRLAFNLRQPCLHFSRSIEITDTTSHCLPACEVLKNLEVAIPVSGYSFLTSGMSSHPKP